MRSLLLAALLLSGCAPDWQSVRIADAAPSCNYVRQMTCVTGKANLEARCEKWHKLQAAESGANTVVPYSASTADYYVCP